MVKLVDTADSKSAGFALASSSLAAGIGNTPQLFALQGNDFSFNADVFPIVFPELLEILHISVNIGA